MLFPFSSDQNSFPEVKPICHAEKLLSPLTAAIEISAESTNNAGVELKLTPEAIGNPFTIFPVPPSIAKILPSLVEAIISELPFPSKSASRGVPTNPISKGSSNGKLSASAPEIFNSFNKISFAINYIIISIF